MRRVRLLAVLTLAASALVVTPAQAATPWVPKPGVQWQWQLSSVPTAAQLKTAYAAGVRAFDVDGDDSSVASVKAIHALGSDVGAVCYVDVGGYESYRADAAKFPKSVIGKKMDGWPENWLDVRQVDVLKPIMAARIQVCKDKGFDAVEPDLLDAWQNASGFPITGAQQITYNRMIADLAHAAGMSVLQKGDVDQAAALQPYFDWTLNEECGAFNECQPLLAYKNAGKAVWIVEYGKARCKTDYPIAGQAAMLKPLELGAKRTVCTSANG